MGTVFTVYVAARPRSVVTKIRRRLRGLNRQRCRAALKYLRECLNADAKQVSSSRNVQQSQLIFCNDTRAINTVNKTVALLVEALASQVKFVPAQ